MKMLQTRAREITEKATTSKRNQYLADCEKWVKKISDTKIRYRAQKGFNNVEIRVSRKFNRSRVSEKFTALGYEVKATANKNKLLIKW